MQGGWSAGVFTASSRDLTALAQSITTCLALPSQSAKTSFLSLLNQHSISKTTTYRKYKVCTYILKRRYGSSPGFLTKLVIKYDLTFN